jgi:Asp/Glu/hydantoin racemase
MVTCSSIGPAVPAARTVHDFPVFRIDDAMATKAVQTAARIGVAATLKTTLEPTVGLLEEKAAQEHRDIHIIECLCNGAFEKVLAGDTEGHDRIVSQALTSFIGKVDVLILAQASMARVVDRLPAGTLDIPVLSSPELAIQQARELVFS